MIWVLVFAGAVTVSVYGAHRLLVRADPFGTAARAQVLPRALIYAAAVVLGSRATEAAIAIDNVTSQPVGLPSSEKVQAIVNVLGAQAAAIAWQAGLLLALSALLESTAARRTRDAH